MNLKNIPEYVPGHNLLKGKKVVITAAAGTGIGFAIAKKCKTAFVEPPKIVTSLNAFSKDFRVIMSLGLMSFSKRICPHIHANVFTNRNVSKFIVVLSFYISMLNHKSSR